MEYLLPFPHMRVHRILPTIIVYYLFLLEFQHILTSCLGITTRNVKESAIDAEFREANLVPTTLPKTPANICIVEFPDRTLNLGTIMEPSEIEKRPKVDWFADPDSLYTLYVPVVADWIFRDSRAETKSKEGVFIRHEWHQWIITNIPGNKINHGDEVYPYNHPPLIHRPEATVMFVYLIYKQKAPIRVPRPKRIHEGYAMNELGYLKDFIKKYNLGKCVAGNFLVIECEFKANSTRSMMKFHDFRTMTSSNPTTSIESDEGIEQDDSEK